jgi:hypothetical protein
MSVESDAALAALQAATNAATAQTTASQALADEVSGKMGAIDAQLTQALAAAISDMEIRLSGLFNKRITSEPVFQIDAGTLKSYTDLNVEVNGVVYSYSEGLGLALPASVALGTDYAIYATPDGLVVSANFTVPDGYTALTSRRVGGFHYQNSEINQYSIWDLKYKPNVRDPRGMARSPMGVWADIYILNTSPDINGTSAYNVTIADGSSPPKIPSFWGGDGTAQYANFDWYTAVKTLSAFGKRPPTQQEFIALATGSVDNYKTGTDPVTTKFDASARSLIGCEGVSGHMWQWGADRYADIAAIFAGNWGHSSTGALVSDWSNAPSLSFDGVSARGVCDHFESL